MHSTANGAGYVKLYRAVKHNRVYQDSGLFHLFSHILLSVNYEQTEIRLDDGRIIQLEPGQMLTSQASIARATGLNPSKVERGIFRLKNEAMIEVIPFSKFRIISVTNWQEYQGSEVMTGEIMRQKPETEKKIRSKEKKDIGVSDSVFEQVAAALNEAAGKQYRSSGAALVKGVSARLKEGFQLNDFIKVVHFKAGQWGADTKMSGYLRPETLFGNKFESYLNEAGGPVSGSDVSTWQDERERQAIDELLEE